MVKRKYPVHIRPSPKYFDFAKNLRSQLEPQLNRRVSDKELTGSLVDFMLEENLTPIFLRRKKRKGLRFK